MTASEELFERACRVIPGGVSNPAATCYEKACTPIYMESAFGSRIRSADGQEFVDYIMSFGSLLFGHAHPQIVAAITGAIGLGVSFGAPCRQEVELAEQLCRVVPSLDMVRMLSSGTEAAASAVRLARACTGRDKLIKFHGGYHGFSDMFMVACSCGGPSNRSVPGSRGVPQATAGNTLLGQYNDLASVETILKRNNEDVAAIIVEPVATSMGVVPPASGFLEGLRKLCDDNGTVLIFDETVTAFRLGLTGGQGCYGVRPDLIIIGKILSGGLPFGAYGGRADLMRELGPQGKLYQGGSTAGNPVVMAAGLAVLKMAEQADYEALEKLTSRLVTGLEEIFAAKDCPVRINQVGSMFTIFFSAQDVCDLAAVQKVDLLRYAEFCRKMRAAGFNFPLTGQSVCMTSFGHRLEDIDRTLEAAAAIEL